MENWEFVITEVIVSLEQQIQQKKDIIQDHLLSLNEYWDQIGFDNGDNFYLDNK